MHPVGDWAFLPGVRPDPLRPRLPIHPPQLLRGNVERDLLAQVVGLVGIDGGFCCAGLGS